MRLKRHVTMTIRFLPRAVKQAIYNDRQCNPSVQISLMKVRVYLSSDCLSLVSLPTEFTRTRGPPPRGARLTTRSEYNGLDFRKRPQKTTQHKMKFTAPIQSPLQYLVQPLEVNPAPLNADSPLKINNC